MVEVRRPWGWFGVAGATAAFALGFWLEPKWSSIDFHTYLAAAAVGMQQGWSHIYDQALVALEQKQLAPSLGAQPFLSPPTVAWLVAPLTVFPYWTAYGVWAAFTFAVLALAFAVSAVSTGAGRWAVVIAALAPWWVLHAVNLGQVVPLVAAGIVIAWRLTRDGMNVAAGLVLSVIWLKPNTAILVPLVLLAAGRYRTVTTWLLAAAVIAGAAALTVGPSGLSTYAGQLLGRAPAGADNVTLHGAFGVTGWIAVALRILVVGSVLVAAFRMRGRSNLAVPLGAVASLVVSPYLHGSDLCVLGAAAWIVWEACPSAKWRVPIALGWLLASPLLYWGPVGAQLHRWPLVEIALLLALIVSAWRPLTPRADRGAEAPA